MKPVPRALLLVALVLAAINLRPGITSLAPLIERNATVRTPDGREFNLNGFQVVDVEKFVALPEATVIEWHRSGWLALIHQHLMSLGRFNDLTRRQVERLAA